MREALGALTTRGRAFLAAGSATAFCAVVLGYDAVLRVGVLAAAVPLLTAAVVSRGRYRLRADRSVAPSRVAVGETATVSLRLANEGRTPTELLLLEDRVPYALGTRPRFVVDHMARRWAREVSYPVRSDGRGHFQVGPLSIRVSDPFGMIELVRTFTATTRLVVTPKVHQLSAVAVSSEWTGSGERRPRAFAVGSAEDVMVREYRRGDDLRRVHWRSTARTGELMVRREEQPWQSRATVLLDGRTLAHEGSGAGASLEWAVSAAASVAVHLTHAGFAVRLVTDHPDGEAFTWHEHVASPQAQSGPILDQLAALRASDRVRLVDAAEAVGHQPGLLVAVLGRLQTGDVQELTRVVAAGRGLAMLLDAATWRSAPKAATAPPAHTAATRELSVTRQAALLRAAGWAVTVVGSGESVPTAWQRLGSQRHERGRSAWSGVAGGADRQALGDLP